MASIRIIEEKCIGCKQCQPACPFGAIEMKGETAKTRKAVITDQCTLCGACVEACKFGAIELIQDEKLVMDTGAYTGVWVYCEQFAGNLRAVGLELLGQASRLARELGMDVTAVLLGHQVEQHAASLIAHGADRVLLADDPRLAELNDMVYSQAMVHLCAQYKPSIILLGATSFGRSFAPRVAAELGTGLTADCTILESDPQEGLLLQTRPAFGGNLMATIVTPHHRPQMATVRPKVFAPLPADSARQGELIRAELPALAAGGVEILELIHGAGDNVNIGDADILIAVGRGIGSEKNIKLAEELAGLLGGAVAVSRPLVDSGWYGYSHQVGQTGKTVAPKIYIACGISGAIQHLAGIAAETIVAVNSDPDAPIFNYAHYAIQADAAEFLESMIESVKAQQIHAV